MRGGCNLVGLIFSRAILNKPVAPVAPILILQTIEYNQNYAQMYSRQITLLSGVTTLTYASLQHAAASILLLGRMSCVTDVSC